MTQTDDPGPRELTYRQLRFEPPPGALDLVLIRHGESEAYHDGRPFPLAGGHGDPLLSPLGIEQARRVCARLATEDVDVIYVSTLRRTAQTAAPLAVALGLPVHVEPRLREVHLGEWEGGEFRKMMSAGGALSQRVVAEERWDLIPGAEPGAEFSGRIRAGIASLAAEHPGQRVAAFTHGGVIGEVLALAAQSRPFAFTGADNASISRLVVSGDRWIVRGFNDTAHLDGLS